MELQKKLADIAHKKDAHEARNDYLLMLLAVVKLHKPQFDLSHCRGCGEPTYPCLTIQTIQQEGENKWVM